MVSAFMLAEGVREGARWGRRIKRSRRTYLEFVVDGESLAPQLGDAIDGMDLVPVLVLNWPGFPAKDYQRLVGGAVASRPEERAALYICPECGDIGCGAITAAVEWHAETVVWRDFAYQTEFAHLGPDDSRLDLDPVVFERGAYLEALVEFRNRWPSNHNR